MDFLQLAQKRYSCRSLTAEPLTSSELDAIIQAARLAPSAMNKQPWKIFLMESPEAKQAMEQVMHNTFGAGTFLVLAADPNQAWQRSYDGKNFADVDLTIAASHMLLEIQQLGLGTTWVGSFDAPGLKRLFPIMKDLDLLAILPIGHPAADAAPSERHPLRKSTQELVCKL